ncbi:hypothetical protein D3H55_01420 [Bacillus salacetis]|uniref:Uncharacterized protein n=1 Tax=Bacillus salacetis TaxID=2315464 RepID=A0A3A1R747_9BACI|nr:hypothetical protein [Bacillus salacetis]RIW39041.1 hypothetical protein D3H55_01420 [Bacillus salacetis]
MKANLQYNGLPAGAISFASLPAFMIFLEEQGYKSRWKSDSRTLDIEHFLYDKKVLLHMKQSGDGLAGQVGKQLKMFLKQLGIRVEMVQEESAIEDVKGDLMIRLELDTENGDENKVSISTTSGVDRRVVKEKILPLFQQADYSCQHLHDHEKIPVPCIRFGIWTNHDSKEQEDFLSTSLTKAVYHLLRKEKSLHFLDLFWDLQNQAPKKPSRSRDNKPREEEAPLKTIHPVEQEARVDYTKPADCDLIFDYSVSVGRKTGKYTVLSSIYLRNSGGKALKNPMLCIKVNPVDSVDLGGQILPPGMSQLFAVQGEQGAQGWEYVGEEWLQTAYSTGEYWIQPIQDLTLQPSEDVLLEGVQFSFESPEDSQNITIAGFVFFNNQEYRFKALNTIEFSF